MTYELRSHPDDAGICGRCSGVTDRSWIERVENVFAPLKRSFRAFSVCRGCGWRFYMPLHPLHRERVGKSPGVLWRMIATWVLLAVSVIGVVGWFVWSDHLDREHARAPMVGDRWTIDTYNWANQNDLADFENAAKYGVLQVTAMSGDQVDLGACNTTSDSESDIESHCETFRVEMPAVKLSAVPDLLENDAIEDITRAGVDYRIPLALLGLYVLLACAHGWQSHRYFTALQRKLRQPHA